MIIRIGFFTVTLSAPPPASSLRWVVFATPRVLTEALAAGGDEAKRPLLR